jgi:hypothetical protein
MRDVIKGGLRGGLSSLSARDRLAMAWVVVCGPRLAAQGEILGYQESDGIVTIEVRGEQWLREMRDMRARLEPELAKIAGVKVSKLHFIVKR